MHTAMTGNDDDVKKNVNILLRGGKYQWNMKTRFLHLTYSLHPLFGGWLELNVTFFTTPTELPTSTLPNFSVLEDPCLC